MRLTYDIAFIEKSFPAIGLTKAEAIGLIDMLGEEFWPIVLDTGCQESVVLGFITAFAADKLNYDYDELRAYICDILDNLDRKNPVHTYDFQGLGIFIDEYRGEEDEQD